MLAIPCAHSEVEGCGVAQFGEVGESVATAGTASIPSRKRSKHPRLKEEVRRGDKPVAGVR